MRYQIALEYNEYYVVEADNVALDAGWIKFFRKDVYSGTPSVLVAAVRSDDVNNVQVIDDTGEGVIVRRYGL